MKGGKSNYGNMVFEWDGVFDPREFLAAKFDRMNGVNFH